ncbi:hypothetical protein LBWT_X2950 (plasmid) [Leptolyngbya boryana IAM M-101]|nr:hypothetical protein LBWT_X2950 [Leptolyngbya boryana IAM M-101]BAS66571.1 hypothetical protein LBDG_X2950 [Leptolyngbya boryana dg5]
MQFAKTAELSYKSCYSVVVEDTTLPFESTSLKDATLPTAQTL